MGFVCAVMCVAMDDERVSGVCGSPNNSLETFSLSVTEVATHTVYYTTLIFVNFRCIGCDGEEVCHGAEESWNS